MRRLASAASFEYHVRLLPAAVEERIRAGVDRPQLGEALIPAAFTGRRIVGRVGRGRFELWIRRLSYNSLAPRAFGEIAATDSGSTVRVRINPTRGARIGIPLILVAAALGGAPILLSIGYHALIIIPMTAAWLATALALWRAPLWGGFPSSEVDELRHFLDRTLQPWR